MASRRFFRFRGPEQRLEQPLAEQPPPAGRHGLVQNTEQRPIALLGLQVLQQLQVSNGLGIKEHRVTTFVVRHECMCLSGDFCVW